MFGNFRRFGSVWFGYRFYTQPVRKKQKAISGYIEISNSQISHGQKTPSNCSQTKTYDTFLDILNDFGFTQMVTQPTRHGNILDLFLTTNPTLIQQVSCKPGISDHDMVTAHCSLTPIAQKEKPCKVPIFRKADWSKFKSLLREYQQEFLTSHTGRSVEEL